MSAAQNVRHSARLTRNGVRTDHCNPASNNWCSDARAHFEYTIKPGKLQQIEFWWPNPQYKSMLGAPTKVLIPEIPCWVSWALVFRIRTAFQMLAWLWQQFQASNAKETLDHRTHAVAGCLTVLTYVLWNRQRCCPISTLCGYTVVRPISLNLHLGNQFQTSAGELRDFTQGWNCSWWRFEVVFSPSFYPIPLSSSQTWNSLSTQRQKVGCSYPGNTESTQTSQCKPCSEDHSSPTVAPTLGSLATDMSPRKRCSQSHLLTGGCVHKQALQLPQSLQHHTNRRPILGLQNSRCWYRLLQYLVRALLARTLFFGLAEHNGAVRGLSSAPPIPAGIRSFRWNSGGFRWNEI